MTGSGTLIAVVGPSGAGKDSVLRFAMERFAEERRVVFPRRFITRPADGGTEDHHPMSEAAFVGAREAGTFALHWRAHGLRYGVPADIETELRAGRVVVVNLSRGVLDAVRRRYDRRVVVAISVETEKLRRRLLARGRESLADIESRLSRMDRDAPQGEDVVTIDNSGPLHVAGERFCDVVAAALAPAASEGAI